MSGRLKKILDLRSLEGREDQNWRSGSVKRLVSVKHWYQLKFLI